MLAHSLLLPNKNGICSTSNTIYELFHMKRMKRKRKRIIKKRNER